MKVSLRVSTSKQNAIKKLISEYYWPIGRNSILSLENKRLLYLAILKLIWLYGITLWGAASQSNVPKVQTRQNIILRLITNAYRYQRNDDIHADLKIPTVREEVVRCLNSYENRLRQHVNTQAIELLDNSIGVHRLKRTRLLF